MQRTLRAFPMSCIALAIPLCLAFGSRQPDNAVLCLVMNAYVAHTGYTTSVSPSTSLGGAIHAGAGGGKFEYPEGPIGAELVNLSSNVPLYIQFNGQSADCESFRLLPRSGMLIAGDKTQLADVRLYAASPCDVGVILYTY